MEHPQNMLGTTIDAARCLGMGEICKCVLPRSTRNRSPPLQVLIETNDATRVLRRLVPRWMTDRQGTCRVSTSSENVNVRRSEGRQGIEVVYD